MIKDAIEDSACLERTQSSLDLYLDGWKGGVMTDMQWCFENSEEAAELINELQRRLAEAEKKIVTLQFALKEALGWNWLDDDHPKELRKILNDLMVTKKCYYCYAPLYSVCVSKDGRHYCSDRCANSYDEPVNKSGR